MSDLCGLFVKIIDQKVYLIHQTAREFLVSQGQLLAKWKHAFDPVQSELVLATSCILTSASQERCIEGVNRCHVADHSSTGGTKVQMRITDVGPTPDSAADCNSVIVFV